MSNKSKNNYSKKPKSNTDANKSVTTATDPVPVAPRYGRTYMCQISSGAGTAAHSSETGFSYASIQVSDNRIKINGTTEKVGVNVSSSIWTVASAFFLMFFVISLGFNIIFYTLAKSDESLIVPKILLGIFLAVGFFPTVISFSRAPRRVKIDLGFHEYMRILFENTADKKSFLREFVKKTDENFIADVKTEQRFYNNATVVPLSKHKFKIITSHDEVECTFRRKSHNKLWFLYFFFLVFTVMPPALIISSLINGTFEPGMLATIIFFVVGIAGMFLPNILAAGELHLKDGIQTIELSFASRKQRSVFSRQLKGDDKRYANSSKIDEPPASISPLKVDTTKKYLVLEINEKLTNLVPIIILGIVLIFFLIGIVAMLITSFNVFGAIIMAVVFLAFFSIAMFIMKENFSILKKRIFRKKAIKYGDIVEGKITDCDTKIFKSKSRTYYFATIRIAFTDQNGVKNSRTISRIFSKDLQFCNGQTVFVNRYKNTYTALKCSPIGCDKEIEQQINSENERLYSQMGTEDKFDQKLLAYTDKDFYKLDTTKPYKIPHKRIIYQILGLVGLVPFFALIVTICVSVVTNNPDDKTQITLAIVVMCMFGLPIFTMLAICLINLIHELAKRMQAAKMLKTATISYGFVSDVDKKTIQRQSKNGSYTVTRIFANIKYIDLDRNIKTICFYESERSILSRSFQKGQKVAVAFKNGKAVILTECSLIGGGVSSFTETETILASYLKEKAPPPRIDAPKSEVILSAYIVYAVIFGIVGAFVIAINLSLFDGVPDMVLRVIMFMLFSSIGFVFIGMSLTTLIIGIKRFIHARRVLTFSNITYAIVYKEDTSHSLFKRVPYIYVDKFGNTHRHYTKEIFFQFKYIKFASSDIFRSISHSSSVFVPPKLTKDDDIMLAVVAYNKHGSVLLRPEKEKKY